MSLVGWLRVGITYRVACYLAGDWQKLPSCQIDPWDRLVIQISWSAL